MVSFSILFLKVSKKQRPLAAKKKKTKNWLDFSKGQAKTQHKKETGMVSFSLYTQTGKKIVLSSQNWWLYMHGSHL